VFNISAMSFGALSANAILALNLGAKMGGFAHDTGEGGISRYHREHGGDLIWEIGSGYFGCRKPDGSFNPERFAEQARDPQVKMIEIKISQGAKPGHGGMLPGAKVTPEIAAARGMPVGVDCVSPSAHSAFSTPVELLQFVARLRELSGGKPTGFKLCIGHIWEWFGIVKAMLETDITPDYIVVDGAEGGTGAAPVEFADHMGAPVQEGLNLVHNTLIGVEPARPHQDRRAGKVINSFDLARMFALGADWCNSGRGFMMALGCIQAQVCHTGRCPTGITTQDPLRQRALVVADKAPRVAQYHANTLHALKELLQAAGLMHPDQLSTSHHIVRRLDSTRIRLLSAADAHHALGRDPQRPGAPAQRVPPVLAAGRRAQLLAAHAQRRRAGGQPGHPAHGGGPPGVGRADRRGADPPARAAPGAGEPPGARAGTAPRRAGADQRRPGAVDLDRIGRRPHAAEQRARRRATLSPDRSGTARQAAAGRVPGGPVGRAGLRAAGRARNAQRCQRRAELRRVRLLSGPRPERGTAAAALPAALPRARLHRALRVAGAAAGAGAGRAEPADRRAAAATAPPPRRRAGAAGAARAAAACAAAGGGGRADGVDRARDQPAAGRRPQQRRRGAAR
jgi:hypothetical protein